MKTWPLVSVCIITYNQENYIKECIESVLMQDYPNIEIIIADDGSTDGTHEILYDYDKRYPNIHLIIQDKNIGITANSNAGLMVCKGKYICAFGGDDVMLSHSIRIRVAMMESNPEVSLCHGAVEAFDNDTNRILYNTLLSSVKIPGSIEINNEINKQIVISTQEQLFKYGNFIFAPSIMMRKSAIPKYGYDNRVPIASDWLMNIDLLANGKSLYINDILARYRRQDKNITNIVTSAENYNFEIDQLNILNIALLKYSISQKYFKKNYASLLRGYRKKDMSRYLYFTLLSMSINFNIKAMIGMIVYFITFGAIKL